MYKHNEDLHIGSREAAISFKVVKDDPMNLYKHCKIACKDFNSPKEINIHLCFSIIQHLFYICMHVRMRSVLADKLLRKKDSEVRVDLNMYSPEHFCPLVDVHKGLLLSCAKTSANIQ